MSLLTCVYVGAYKGYGLYNLRRTYDRFIVMEPYSAAFEELQLAFGNDSRFELLHAAATVEHGSQVTLHISSNDGGSSSLGKRFNPEWLALWPPGGIDMVEKEEVFGLNVLQLLRDRGIGRVDEYVSDIQGMDLEILKTLRPMLEEKRIQRIRCEVSADQNLYEGLPDNSFRGFLDLLTPLGYELWSTGWGDLVDRQFKYGKTPETLPKGLWEFDAKWVAR